MSGHFLGRATAVKRVLAGSLSLKPFDRAGKDHWVGQSRSGKVSVEVIGDPVRQVSVILPVMAGAGLILGQFLNEYSATGPEAPARVWAEAELLAWSSRLLKDPDEALDANYPAGQRSIRLQSLGSRMVVVTVGV